MGDLSKREHELLCDVLAGDRSAQDPEVARAAERNPIFAERLRELASTEEHLAGAGRDMQRTLDEASEWSDAPGEQKLAESVLGPAQRRPAKFSTPREGSARKRRVRGRRWLIYAGIAASMLLVLGVWLDRPGFESPIWMGEAELRILYPNADEAWDHGSAIRWDGELPASGEFRVRIRSAKQADPLARPLLQHETTKRAWTPDARKLAGHPEGLVVEVSSHTSDGTVQAVVRVFTKP